MNAEKSLWNYILTVGNDEETLGMVDVWARGGDQLGKIRIDALIEKFKKEVPEKSKKEKEFESQIWKAEDFIFDQALYDKIMDEDKKRKEEEKARALKAKEEEE